MKVTKRTLCYLTTSTFCYVEPDEYNTVFFEMTTGRDNTDDSYKKISSRLSINDIPIPLLKHQLKRMCTELDIPYRVGCQIGGKYYKQQIKEPSSA